MALTGCDSTTQAPPATAAVNGTPAVCNPNEVTAYPDGRGSVAVYVHASGPDVVDVDLKAFSGTDHRHLHQQVTKHDSGASFDFSYLMGELDSITVSTNNLGICQVPPRWRGDDPPWDEERPQPDSTVPHLSLRSMLSDVNADNAQIQEAVGRIEQLPRWRIQPRTRNSVVGPEPRCRSTVAPGSRAVD